MSIWCHPFPLLSQVLSLYSQVHGVSIGTFTLCLSSQVDAVSFYAPYVSLSLSLSLSPQVHPVSLHALVHPVSLSLHRCTLSLCGNAMSLSPQVYPVSLSLQVHCVSLW